MSTRTISPTAPRALSTRVGEEVAPVSELATSRSNTAALVTLPTSASEEEA
ncbi:MAG TPA: hypothetical protein VD814_01215 [Nocardioides sp.]|nr:hypothetical protein [Nocardioides sp.]